MNEPPPSPIFFSGAEAGGEAEWTSDGVVVGGVTLHGAQITVSSERAHGGGHAFRIDMDTADHLDHSGELYRRASTGRARYSGWFYLEGAHVPAVYWTIFSFFARAQADSPATRSGLWDLNLDERAVYFYDEVSKRFVDAMPAVPYPVGQWFHLEAVLDTTSPDRGRLAVWQDGQQILDLQGLTAPAGATLYWAVGSETNQLSPSGCTLYVDDLSITPEP